MTADAHIAHADILDERDSLKGPFFGALTVHVLVIGGLTAYSLWESTREKFGAAESGGGAIAVQAVDSIPLPSRGRPNPVANDTESQVPQAPPKAKEQEKKRPEPKDAVALKDRSKKKKADAQSDRQKFRPFDELDPNQVTAKRAPQLSSPMFSAQPGAGTVGSSAASPLGSRFPAYAQQVQRLIVQKWQTGQVDARIQTAPIVIATFDLLRNGNVRNLQLLQKSGVPALDLSVQRAILEASPFPPIPAGFDRESAKIEFWFEFKR
jgi:periplasmic protein TonB